MSRKNFFEPYSYENYFVGVSFENYGINVWEINLKPYKDPYDYLHRSYRVYALNN